MPAPIVPLTWSDSLLQAAAAVLAEQFQLPLAFPDESHDLRLVLTSDHLELRSASLALHCDFLTGPLAHRIRAGSHNAFRGEALLKALSCKPDSTTHVIDATAGLGRDSILLALAGFHVTAIEQHPAVAALLHDGLSRALADDAFRDQLGDRLSVRIGNAVDLIPQLPPAAAIYLDPMFPPRRKSAGVKKQMQLLQLLHDDAAASHNEQQLLDAALAHTTFRGRVIVKRPRLAPPLAGRDPTFTRTDKTIRYDIYLPSSCNA